MAYPTGVAFKLTSPTLGAQPIHETSTTQKHPLGMVVKARDVTYGEGEFIYLKGAASTAQGDLCCYDSSAASTTRSLASTAASTGPAGVAMSDNVASQYGWYQIGGAGPVKAATVSANTSAYLTATAGQVDDLVSSGQKVDGMILKAATVAGYATAQMDRPSVTGESVSSAVATLIADLDTAEAAIVTNASAITTINAHRKISLSAAVEDTDAIVVTGQVTDLLGVNIGSATQVLVRTLAVTADKGDITVTAGTERETVNPATGENYSWIETTASGGFAVSVANDAAERTLVHASAAGALTATLSLTFAA